MFHTKNLITEDPDDPLEMINHNLNISFDSDDAYTWTIRKPGLYLIGKTLRDGTYKVYHNDIDEFINRIIRNKYNRDEINSLAKSYEISIFGKYNSYQDFLTTPTDNRGHGYLTGRYWSRFKIIASWDNDSYFISKLPEVIKMLKQAFQLTNDEIKKTKVDLDAYNDMDNMNLQDVKTINDIYRGKYSREETESEKERRQQRIQMHIEKDPAKRAYLQKKFGLNKDMTYKKGIPSLLKRYLERDPKFFHKINWEKWGLSKDEASALIQNTISLLQEDPVDPLNNMADIPDGLKNISMFDKDSFTWVIRKPGLYLFGKSDDGIYHGTISSLIFNILNNKITSREDIKKMIQQKNIGIVGSYNTYKDFKIDDPTDFRKMGYLTGRVWLNSKIISSYDDDKLYLERISEVANMLSKAFNQEDIGEYIIDLQSYDRDNITFSDIKRIKDVLGKAVSARELTDDEKELRDLRLILHTTTDPYKKRMILKKLGLLGPMKYKLDIPPMLLARIKDNPKSVNRIRWSRWGIKKGDVLKLLRLGLISEGGDILGESPDRLTFSKFNISGGGESLTRKDAYTFTALTEEVILITRVLDMNGRVAGTHSRLSRFIEDIYERFKNESSTSEVEEWIIKQSRLRKIKIIGKLTLELVKNIKLNSPKHKYRNILNERWVGIFCGRLWTDLKIISIWQPDNIYKKHLKTFTKILKYFNFTDEEILNFKIDLDGPTNVSTFRKIINQQLDSETSEEKFDDMKRAHLEIDPNKRKAIQKKLGIRNNDGIIDKIPKMILSALRRDPELFNSINFSKWGITPAEAKQLIMTMNEDADRIQFGDRRLGAEDPNSVAFGYTNGVLFYRKGISSNHQQIYYELKAKLAPNYPKLEKAMDMGRYDIVNKFIHQIIKYLNNRGIIVKGDLTNITGILRDINDNDIESIDISKMDMTPENFDKLRKSAFNIRTKVFEVSGRGWTNAHIVSFWNSVDISKKCVTVWGMVDKANSYVYEFIDDVDIFHSYQEAMGGKLKRGKPGDMAKLHTEKDPAIKAALRNRIRGNIDDDDYWKDREDIFKKRGNLASWQRDSERGLAEEISLTETPDRPTDGWRGLGTGNDKIYCFVILTNNLFVVQKNGYHGEILRLLTYCYENKINDSKNIQKIAKDGWDRTSPTNILFYGNTSKLSMEYLLENVRNLKQTIEQFTRSNYVFRSSGEGTPFERNYGLAGRCWVEKIKNLPPVISFWSSDKEAVKNIGSAIKMLSHIGLSNKEIMNLKLDFDSDKHITIKDVIGNNIKVSSVEKDMGQAHIEVDPIKRKLLRKRMGIPDERVIRNKLDLIPPMIRRRVTSDPSSINKINWSKFGLKKDEVVSLLTEGTMDKYFDNKSGIGAVPFNQDIDCTGFIVRMTPREFRRIVPAGVSDPHSMSYVKQALKTGQKLGPPFLEVSWDEKNKVWQTVGHEGRSRMDAIAEVFGNDVLVPVHMFTGSGMRARHVTDDMKRAVILPQG